MTRPRGKNPVIYLTCEACGYEGNYEHSAVESDQGYSWVICDRCTYHITLATETITIGEKLQRREGQPVEVLKEGDVVRLDNPDHVWHNEIAIICGRKPKFYRLEINGKRIWVPKEWVKET